MTRYALEDVVFLAEAIRVQLERRSFDLRSTDDYVLSFPEKLTPTKSKSKSKKRSTFEYRDDDDEEDDEFLHVRALVSKQKREKQEKASATTNWDTNPWILKQRREMDALETAAETLRMAEAAAALTPVGEDE